MNNELLKKNNALRHLGVTVKGKKRFVFSKLGNELTLITTKLCNLNCSFCYDKANVCDKDALKKLEKELTPNEIIRLIELSKRLGVGRIRLTGGEAILKEGFFDILQSCGGMDVSLCSNGLILKDKLDEIVRIHPENLHIHLSLEGTESHKIYRKGSNPYQIVELASYIKKKYPAVRVSINTVINKEFNLNIK